MSDPSHTWENLLETVGAEAGNEVEKDEALVNQLKTGDETVRGFVSLNRQINNTYSLPVHNGKGAITTEKKTTWGVKIQGKATIIEPENGTWHLVVKDLVYPPPKYPPIIDRSNVKANTPIEFEYKTGFHAQLGIEVVWSENANTNLRIHVEAGF